jgi:hypothetical protein
MKTPEGAVVKACLEYLQIRGVFAWRNNSGSLRDKNNRPVYFGKTGSADIIGILPGGHFICVECKAGKNKPSGKQVEFLRRVSEMGGAAILAWSVDDVIKGLDQFEQKIARSIEDLEKILRSQK